MRTQKGAAMSPRMERLWRYIREERGINLCDFSTDEHVEREQGRLRAGEAELARRVQALREPYTAGDLEVIHLLADYRAIMNRRPRERV